MDKEETRRSWRVGADMGNHEESKNMNKMAMAMAVSAVILCACAGNAQAAADNVTIDFSHDTGPVRPVNGVGQPPVVGYDNFSLIRHLKEAGIPYSRLHDVGGAFGKNIFVDIPNLFRDFDADENDPKNYDFAFTDLLINALVENGVEPYFRLGVTIENACNVKAYRIHPPKDAAKWARICEHVVAHYTEGWADGFRHKITYWEIWNEPDNNVENQNPGRPFRNLNWWGTFDEYLDLYEVASKHLKRRFPQIKVGGYASCGFYATTRPKDKWRDWGSDVGHYVVCFDKFLERVKSRDCPVDFFSFHSYADVPTTARHVDYAKRRLREAGLGGAELHVNEWLPHHSMANLGTAFQAAEVAAMLAVFQEHGVDVGCIYDARWGLGEYAPLFNPLTREPYKALQSFKAFKALRDMGTSVKCAAGGGLYATAATDGKGRGAVLVSNIDRKNAKRLECDFGGWKVREWRVLDATRDLEPTRSLANVPPSTVLLAIVEKDAESR